VRQLVDVRTLLLSLEHAFISLSSGLASVPPRTAALQPDGSILAAMPGYVENTLATKLVSIFPKNTELGLPTVQAVIILFDNKSGEPQAVMDGTYITAMRTGGSTAVATRLLARPESKVLAILGCGVQGRAHLETVPLVRDFTEVRLASRNRNRAEQLASSFPGTRVMDTFEEAVRGADVVCACTDAAAPILHRSWLKSGAHVASVGFGAGPELDRETITQGSLFVESRDAFSPYPSGAHELQGIDPREATELGEALSGTRPGRRSDEEITVYKSTGHAVEDAAAARVVYDAAVKAGIGVAIRL